MHDEKLWKLINETLEARGVNLGELCCRDFDPSQVKVVCVAANLADSIREVGDTPRDQVIVARVDGETVHQLDTWIAAGAARSRSEAAALFIREGLKVRSDELAQLDGALREVEDARERLRHRARGVFGGEA